MPRIKKTPAPDTGLDQQPITIPAVNAEAALNQGDLAVMHHAEILMRVGQTQAHAAYSKLSRMAVLQFFEEVQQTKAYKGLPFKDEAGTTLTVSTIQEFCTHYLNMSYTHLKEESERLRLLGEDAYTSARELGIKRNDLRLISKLPDDDREIVQSALEAKDKDSVLEVLERFVTKSTHERAELTKKVEDLTKQQEANEQLITKKNEKIDELDRKLSRPRTADEVSDEQALHLTREVQKVLGELLVLDQAIGEIVDRGDDAPTDLKDACTHAIRRIKTRVEEIESDYRLLEVGPSDDSWMAEAQQLDPASAKN